MKNEAWYETDDGVLDALRIDAATATLQVPGYAQLVELARGGQGVVYAGVDTASGQRIALKVLREDRFASTADRRRFEREVDLAAVLDHPNVVKVIDHGTTADGRRFLVMPYIAGRALDEHVLGPDRRLWPQTAAGVDDRVVVDLLIGVCDAVAHAHQRGVIHRDLKPSNIRVADDSGLPRVLDFGMAAPFGALAADRGREPTTTLTGEFIGSLAWASPEQVESAANVDVRSDVYALGLILYTLLTGRTPYDTGGSLREALDRIVTAEPVPPSRWRPVDADLETIVLRCLRKDPADRYPTTVDLRRDLAAWRAGEPIESRRERAWRRLQAGAVRARRRMAAGLTAIVALLVLCGSLAVLVQRTLRAERLAEERLRETIRESEHTRRAIEFLQNTFESVNPGGLAAADPTVRGLLAAAAARLDVDLAGQPEATAIVALTIGRTLFNLGDVGPAESLLRRSVALSRAQIENARTDSRAEREARRRLAEGLEALGSTMHAVDRYDDARAAMDEAAALYEALGDTAPGETDRLAVDAAVLLAAQGRLDEAETRLLAIYERGVTRGDPVAGLSAHRLGQIAGARSDLAAADEWYDRALADLARYGDGGRLAIADVLLGKGEVAMGRHDAEAARRHIDEAIAIYRERLGPSHPRIADCLLVLGAVETHSGDAAKAHEHFREAIAMADETLGPRGHTAARARERYGAHLVALGDFEEAERQLTEALAIFTEVHQPGHPDIVETERQLGDVERVRAGR